jgi:rhodanese-related sulfurtransferase
MKFKNARIGKQLQNHYRMKTKEIIKHSLLDKTIILFCRSGRRSGLVGEALKTKGYKVLNLGGHEA